MTDANAAPWYSAFPDPNPTTLVKSISASQLADKIRSVSDDSSAYIVVDLRRTDFEDVAITGAINLPAHSFYPTLPTVLQVLSRYKSVVFHCGSCKPGSRGTRCASWYQEAVDKAGLNAQTEAVVLEGGIKAWISEYGEDEKLSIKL